MSRSTKAIPQLPALEIRCGGLHLTIQRAPVWLISLITTASGVGAAWWAHQ